MSIESFLIQKSKEVIVEINLVLLIGITILVILIDEFFTSLFEKKKEKVEQTKDVEKRLKIIGKMVFIRAILIEVYSIAAVFMALILAGIL
jgi:hypothetical protein